MAAARSSPTKSGSQDDRGEHHLPGAGDSRLARRTLILTPASLVGQWQGELEEKFFHTSTPRRISTTGSA